MKNYLIKLFNKISKNYVIVPVKPPRSLLVSMAMREDHAFGMGFGMSDEDIQKIKDEEPIMANQYYTSRERECMLSTMKQLHEEVVGKGFYNYNVVRKMYEI